MKKMVEHFDKSQYCYPQDVQALLDMSASLDPRFKDLDPFVDVTDRVDVEEAVKFEALELAEGNNTESDDIVEAVTVDDMDENDILSNINQPQDQEQSSSSVAVPPKRKRKGAVLVF